MAKQEPLTGEVLICRRILARSYWDAHNNAACRGERDRALTLYNTLTKEQKEQIPQVLRVWLRYRSEKYFGVHRTPPGGKRHKSKAVTIQVGYTYLHTIVNCMSGMGTLQRG